MTCLPAAGESYAGMYIPMLTREVVEGNTRGDQPHINIKVGKPPPSNVLRGGWFVTGSGTGCEHCVP